ncbi:hypothetical protein IV203_020723 [Nitzschia inconspicua]|uniref:Uncharacterized protein n=1 Tax=Nitzschia inconspicua TaxID=303405 RepID=A0A9K3K8P2_9STRA|nr:hypothetical protein IV203_021587 [Nitzschia inconspicua]KAG7342779.1 hypothetical protein IV203_020723 [Nitzschia inconspicua]
MFTSSPCAHIFAWFCLVCPTASYSHDNRVAEPPFSTQPLNASDFYLDNDPKTKGEEQRWLEETFPLCRSDNIVKKPCRNTTAEAFFSGIEDLKSGKPMTRAQVDAISWLGSDEIMAVGGVIVQRLSPTDWAGNRSLQFSNCPGVLSAICNNYAPGNDASYSTHLTHYPPKGGEVTAGWGQYTQLVYDLNQNQLHRVWARCASTYLARKKWLLFNHGLNSFNKKNYSKAEVWIRKQAYCCGYGLCSFSDW